MRRRQSARIVLFFVIISLILLILSFAGVLNSPIAGADRFARERQAARDLGAPDRKDPQAETQESKPLNTTDNTETDSTKEPQDPEESEQAVIVPLPVNANDADLLAPSEEGLLRVWPEEYSLPRLHEVDFEYYSSLQEESRPLNGITVILDPSFGGSATGATAITDSGVLAEKDIVLAIAQIAERYLTEMGADVIMTRASDIEHSLFYVAALTADTVLERYKAEAEAADYDAQLIDDLRLQMSDVMRINQNNADSGGRGLFGSVGTPSRLRLIYDIQAQYQDVLFINISLNQDGDPDVSGSEIRLMDQDFVTDVNNSYVGDQDPNTLAPNYSMTDSQSRVELAWLLYGHLQHQIPTLASEAEPQLAETDMAVLRLNNLTSVSIVPGYLTNASDRAEISSLAGQQKIASAIAYAVRQYYVGP
ncbi:MAG: N-acetylmuramoyl-L-alanine amidase [Eubacteriales bacterium]|nr:N-acetylmuramoyl-L-alanine amidase [Eubacteriales bacterium]